jgi:hypothetical protein
MWQVGTLYSVTCLMGNLGAPVHAYPGTVDQQQENTCLANAKLDTKPELDTETPSQARH